MACRELFSCLPRSTASDTAAGATATVSEAKPTSPGCQALRCTPAMLRVCVWAAGAGGGGGEGRSQAGSGFEWQLDSATFPKSTKRFLFCFFSHGVHSYWGVRGPQVFQLYSSSSQLNKSIALCYLLSSHSFSLFPPLLHPQPLSTSLQSVCSALWALCGGRLSCRAGDACRGRCVPPALLHLQRLFLPPADWRSLRPQGGTATVCQRGLPPVSGQPNLFWHRYRLHMCTVLCVHYKSLGQNRFSTNAILRRKPSKTMLGYLP